ncbi:MAG TPA: DUF4331 family protein [Gemmatimonadales bacterium]|nr:DUF4331 family protein [Gemmatimonadales bacterium]
MTSHCLRRRAPATAAALFALVLAAGCGDDDDNGTGPVEARAFNQIQRLGNPLVSEVLLAKRSHATHGSIGPADDAALIGAEAKSFITTVAGRSQAYADAIAPALIPDMLRIQTDKDPTTAGWLSWLPQLGGGWGGRRLTDDVVDLALLAVFGDPFGLEPATATPGLTTDNVASDSPVLPAFPYLGAPN